MATTKNILKQWFSNFKKPTQEQFWAWMDSFWHKDEKIPINSIEGLDEALQNTADNTKIENHFSDTQAHKSLFDLKVDKETGKGLSSNDYSDMDKQKVSEINQKENVSNKSSDIEAENPMEKYPSLQLLKQVLQNLENSGIFTAEVDQAAAQLLLKNKQGTTLKTLPLGFLNNEGTTIEYNSQNKKLELKNDAGEILSSFPASALLTKTAKALELSDFVLKLIDNAGAELNHIDLKPLFDPYALSTHNHDGRYLKPDDVPTWAKQEQKPTYQWDEIKDTEANVKRKIVAIDLRDSSWDTNKWYPIVTGLISNEKSVLIRVYKNLNGEGNITWGKHNNSAGVFSLSFEYENNGNGWNTIPTLTKIKRYLWDWVKDNKAPIIQLISDWKSSRDVLYLRGGGYYYFDVPNGVSVEKHQQWNNGNGDVYNPKDYSIDNLPIVNDIAMQHLFTNPTEEQVNKAYTPVGVNYFRFDNYMVNSLLSKYPNIYKNGMMINYQTDTGIQVQQYFEHKNAGKIYWRSRFTQEQSSWTQWNILGGDYLPLSGGNITGTVTIDNARVLTAKNTIIQLNDNGINLNPQTHHMSTIVLGSSENVNINLGAMPNESVVTFLKTSGTGKTVTFIGKTIVGDTQITGNEGSTASVVIANGKAFVNVNNR